MPLTILGLGTAVPPDVTRQADALNAAKILGDPAVRDAKWLPNVYERSGVETRHQVLGGGFVADALAGTRDSGSPFLPGPDQRGPRTALRMRLYAEHAPPLALDATRKALAESGVSPGRVTHLVTVSCTGFFAPGVDQFLIRTLKMSDDVERVHVGFMGCHGAINGLRTALALAQTPGAVVLLVCVELSSVHYYTGDVPDKVVANALFADGAAALVGVGERVPGKPAVTATGSRILPDTSDDMSWTVGDYGFEMTLSQRIAPLIGAAARPWLTQWLAPRGLTPEAVRSWAVHPGGPRILNATQEALGLTTDQMAASRAVLAECGTMSSPTVLFIYDRLRRAAAAGPTVLLAFGPGLVAEAALVE
jgi:alpha-pyrone synthase